MGPVNASEAGSVTGQYCPVSHAATLGAKKRVSQAGLSVVNVSKIIRAETLQSLGKSRVCVVVYTGAPLTFYRVGCATAESGSCGSHCECRSPER